MGHQWRLSVQMLSGQAVSACRYVQLENAGAWHMKNTLVRQGPRSLYELTEASLGGSIARHDINIEQVHRCVLMNAAA